MTDTTHAAPSTGPSAGPSTGPSTPHSPPPSRNRTVDLSQVQQRALMIGGVGLVLCVLGAVFNLPQFFRSYLLAYVFWLGIAVGSLGVAMLNRLSGGAWGMVIRRLLEAGARTLPVMALLFLPIAFGLPHIYEWARPEEVAGDPLLEHKSVYLNGSFFLARTAFYFIVWSFLIWGLSRWSLEQDRNPDPELARRLRIWSSGGLLLLILTFTFAAYDWLMSLEPHWFSSIFGAVVGAGSVLAAMAFMVGALSLLVEEQPVAEVTSPGIFNDLGSLMLAFVMVWGYVSLSQFLLIWSANLPEEAIWYVERTVGGWEWIGIALVLFHFALPFFLLLAQQNRRNLQMLTRIALLILLMHFIDLFWVVAPTFAPGRFRLHLLDIFAMVAVGGVWVALFIWQLKDRPLIPLLEVPYLRARADRERHGAH